MDAARRPRGASADRGGGGDDRGATPFALARREVEAVVRSALGRRRARVECRVVAGEPADAIVDAAHDVDSVVMSTVGRTGLSRMLLGSVAEKVVRLSPKPVLTLRPEAVRTRSRRRRAPRVAGRRRPD